MKILNLTILLIIYTNLIFAQTEPKPLSFEEKIKLEINDASSQYYYPNLLNKINSEPEKISKEDIRHLYYGQIYQKGTGLSFIDHPDIENFRKAVAKSNCKSILKLGQIILHDRPVELTTLVPTSSCQTEEKTENKYLNTRLKKLLDVTFETGDGKSRETAIKISNIEDDFILKEILGFKGGRETHETIGGKVYSVWINKKQKIYFEDCWSYKYQ